MTGTKHDQGKPRPELIPPSAINGAARVFAFGAKKYDDRNWEKGIDFSRLYGALLRHVNAFWDGQDKDDESGDDHLAHALCCLMMLYEHSTNPKYTEFDDRPGMIKFAGQEYKPEFNTTLDPGLRSLFQRFKATQEDLPINELCRCGHLKADHIYHDGACRPGYVCKNDCAEFTPISIKSFYQHYCELRDKPANDDD
jgi:hypothetical protein